MKNTGSVAYREIFEGLEHLYYREDRRRGPVTILPFSVDVHLSPRDSAVLSALRDGLSEKQVARRLGISRHTVHVYIRRVYRRYDVSSIGELLAIWASENAWGQRSRDLTSPQGNQAPSIAEELARAAEHLSRAPQAAGREDADSATRGAIAAALIHVESVDATVKKLRE